MIELDIPGGGQLTLEHLVCDVNGTLALDGQLIEGVAQKLNSLRDRLEIHLLTADTHGKQAFIDQQLNLRAVRVHPGSEHLQKSAYIQELGPDRVVAIGQGANDVEMLKSAGLGICILSEEGAASEAVMASDVVVRNILDALELLERPLRLVATLRR